MEVFGIIGTVLLIICMILIILEIILHNRRKYKYEFQGMIVELLCKNFDKISTNTKVDKSRTEIDEEINTTNISHSQGSEKNIIKCKMKIRYNPQDLDTNDKKTEDFFFIPIEAEEPYLIGEMIDFVSNSKNSKKFKICCPWDPAPWFLPTLLTSFVVGCICLVKAYEKK